MQIVHKLNTQNFQIGKVCFSDLKRCISEKFSYEDYETCNSLMLSNAFSDQVKPYFSCSVKCNYEILAWVRSTKRKNTEETIFCSACNNFVHLNVSSYFAFS